MYIATFTKACVCVYIHSKSANPKCISSRCITVLFFSDLCINVYFKDFVGSALYKHILGPLKCRLLDIHTYIYIWNRIYIFIATLWTVTRQAPLFLGFSRQEYCSGLPCPPPRDLPNPGIEPTYLLSPALAGGFFTTSATLDNYRRYTHTYTRIYSHICICIHTHVCVYNIYVYVYICIYNI